MEKDKPKGVALVPFTGISKEKIEDFKREWKKIVQGSSNLVFGMDPAKEGEDSCIMTKHHENGLIEIVNREKPLTFEEFCDKKQKEIDIELAETGANREMDFDPEAEYEKRYNKYLEDPMEEDTL